MTCSVALCTFNGAAYVRDQLESIARQESPPTELVVCDDRSSDATVEIVRAFGATVPFPVRLHVNEENLGSTENFARAIALCRSSVIALCDQDDVWRPQKLKRLTETLKSEPDSSLVFSNAAMVDPAGRPLGHSVWAAGRVAQENLEALCAGPGIDVLLKRNVVTGATMAFRSHWRELLLPIPKIWVHDAWIALVLGAVSRFSVVTEQLIDYRQHPGQQIGVRRLGLYAQYQMAKRETASSFLETAERCSAAAERLESQGDRYPAALKAAQCLRGRAAHFLRRSRMRLGEQRKLRVIASELRQGNYARYAHGWKSVAQDLWLD